MLRGLACAKLASLSIINKLFVKRVSWFERTNEQTNERPDPPKERIVCVCWKKSRFRPKSAREARHASRVTSWSPPRQERALVSLLLSLLLFACLARLLHFLPRPTTSLFCRPLFVRTRVSLFSSDDGPQASLFFTSSLTSSRERLSPQTLARLCL